MFVCFQLLDFIIPPKQLLKGTKCFIWKEAQKVDYNHWKNGYLMKNECMVPPVTRYENSSKAWKPFCHVCLLPLRIVPAKTRSSFAQMGNLLSESRAVSNDTAKQAQHSTFHRAFRAADEHIRGMSAGRGTDRHALSCLQTR